MEWRFVGDCIVLKDAVREVGLQAAARHGKVDAGRCGSGACRWPDGTKMASKCQRGGHQNINAIRDEMDGIKKDDGAAIATPRGWHRKRQT